MNANESRAEWFGRFVTFHMDLEIRETLAWIYIFGVLGFLAWAFGTFGIPMICDLVRFFL